MEVLATLIEASEEEHYSTGRDDTMRPILSYLLMIVVLCSGCATMVAEAPQTGSRPASGGARPVILGTAPGGSTRYPGAAQIVEKDTLAVFAVDGYTRLQIGYGKRTAHIDLDHAARLRLIEGLRKTYRLCETARQSMTKGVTVVDTIPGAAGPPAAPRGSLEIAFSAMVLADGTMSCANILALKQSGNPMDNPAGQGDAAVQAIALSAVPHLIDVLERVPRPNQTPPPTQGRF